MALLKYKNIRDEQSFAYTLDGRRILFQSFEEKVIPIALIPNSDVQFIEVVETGAPLKVLSYNIANGSSQDIDLVSEVQYPLDSFTIMVDNDCSIYFNDDVNSKFKANAGFAYQFTKEDLIYIYKITIEADGSSAVNALVFLNYGGFNEK